MLYLRLINLSVGDAVFIDSETLLVLLVTDFVNLKIKSVQSFKCAHKNKIYVRIFILVSAHKYLHLYCVCQEKKSNITHLYHRLHGKNVSFLFPPVDPSRSHTTLAAAGRTPHH
jgi:hypothetical protein